VTTATATKTAGRRKPAEKTTVHPLNHLVPGKWFADDYISRTIESVADLDVMAYAAQTRENVLLFGPTGPGKTSCVYAYAHVHGLPLVNVPCNGAIDPSTLFGRPNLEADGTVTYVESNIVTAIRHGGVIYLDEINFAPPRIMAVLHGALDKRREVTIPELGNLSIKLHPKCQIIATYNPGYEGTKPLNKAFHNRFGIKLEFGYSREIEEQLIVAIPALLDIADKLRTACTAGDLETPVSTNLLREFEDHACDLGVPFAVCVFLNAFHDHERSSVRNTIEHYLDEINEQVAASTAAEGEK